MDGPYQLGRKQSPPDDRDYPLAAFLAPDPLDAALKMLTSSHAAAAAKVWSAVATSRVHALEGAAAAILSDVVALQDAVAALVAPPAPGPAPAPAPAPTPTPPAPEVVDVVWGDPRQLNQGTTRHCVGFAWAQWANADPVEDTYADADGHLVYYECKALDGEPAAEDGSYVRTGAKAMQDRGRLQAYAFASSTDEITAWVRAHGPVVVGTDWYDAMFTPDARGIVAPGGALAGGHAYLLIGVNAGGNIYEFQNSWGPLWGIDGRCRMAVSDFASLLAADGEAVAAVELPAG